MNKTLNTILAMISSFSLAFAGESPVATNVPMPTPSFDVKTKVFAASVISDSDEVFGGGLSLEVPLVYDLKLEVTGSVFEDDVFSAGANFLYYIPVTDKISFYTLAGGGYEFETDQWAVNVGGGVSYQLNPQLSLFADGQYNFIPDGDNDGVTTVRLGVGFKF